MDCEGIVTQINSDYFYFELDNVTRIHMSILLSEKKDHKMPKLGSKIIIKNACRQEPIYVVCKLSELNGDFSVDYVRNIFLKLVKKFKFGAKDLHKVDKIVNYVNKNFFNVEEHIRVHIIHRVLRNISYVFDNTKNSDDICENTCISEYDITTATSCRYVDIFRGTFSKFPYWSFGVHSNPEKTFLLCSFEIHPLYGLLLLKDSHYHLTCIVYNVITPQMVSQMIDNYLLIENYTVITEIYNQSNITNIEYILVDFDDINIIYPGKKFTFSSFGEALPSDRTFLNNINFQIMRKSSIRVEDNNVSQCWFQILIKHTHSSLEEEAYLIVPSNYIRITNNLEEGGHYTLSYNKPLKNAINVELTRVKKLPIYELEDDGFFTKSNEANTYTQNVLSVQECKDYIADKTDLVSFEGILKYKKFRDPLSSRTTKKHNVYGFGTPGPQVHQLVFRDMQSPDIHLDCYLNNWENVLMPLGLIPDMWVVVRNVYPQSKKYLKSSVFTTFEIKSYDPPVKFETVNLYDKCDLNWGRPFFLGYGNRIPTGVLIWGRTYNVHILKVRMTRQCVQCEAVQKLESCSRCQINDTKLNFLATMHVSDEFGQSRVIVKCPDIMKTLLDLQDYQYQRWLIAFTALGEYEYNYFEEKHITDETPARAYFRETITDFLKLVNKQGILQLELKCRKLESSPQAYGGRALWFCVDARRFH